MSARCGAQVVVEVAHVPGDLVEVRGHPERQVLTGVAGVAVGGRRPAQACGCALDDVVVGADEVDRVATAPPGCV
jgi:hypothetical protein